MTFKPFPIDKLGLFKAAGIVAIKANFCGVSLIQRSLDLGYNHAAEIIELLEENKVIGPFNCEKSREVLMNEKQFEELCKNIQENTLSITDTQ